MPALYDEIGRTYTGTRRQDPLIMAAIEAALGRCESVLNVGAGPGAARRTAAPINSRSARVNK